MIRCHLSTLMGREKLRISDVAKSTGLNRSTVTALYNETATGMKRSEKDHLDPNRESLDKKLISGNSRAINTAFQIEFFNRIGPEPSRAEFRIHELSVSKRFFTRTLTPFQFRPYRCLLKRVKSSGTGFGVVRLIVGLLSDPLSNPRVPIYPALREN